MSIPNYHRCGSQVDVYLQSEARCLSVTFNDPSGRGYPAITHCSRCGDDLYVAYAIGELTETKPLMVSESHTDPQRLSL